MISILIAILSFIILTFLIRYWRKSFPAPTVTLKSVQCKHVDRKRRIQHNVCILEAGHHGPHRTSSNHVF